VVITFGTILVLWLIESFSSGATGSRRTSSTDLSVIGHLDDFIKGVHRYEATSSIYVTFALMGLFLTYRSLESLRWKKADDTSFCKSSTHSACCSLSARPCITQSPTSGTNGTLGLAIAGAAFFVVGIAANYRQIMESLGKRSTKLPRTNYVRLGGSSLIALIGRPQLHRARDT